MYATGGPIHKGFFEEGGEDEEDEKRATIPIKCQDPINPRQRKQ